MTKPRSAKQQAAHAKFMRPLQPDVKLAAIVGSTPIPGSEITKRIWNYIKQHDLQGIVDRRTITLDNALRPLFDGRHEISMFEIPKAIKAHTQPLAEG